MTAPTTTRTHQHCTTTCGCHPATPWMYTTTSATPADTTTTRSDTFFAYVEHACNAYVALLALLVFIVLINR